MGAGCSSSKVANQVKPGAVIKVGSKQELSQKAKEHFKDMKSDDPLGDTQSANALQNTLKKFKIDDREGDESQVEDKDLKSNFEGDGTRMHEPLW